MEFLLSRKVHKFRVVEVKPDKIIVQALLPEEQDEMSKFGWEPGDVIVPQCSVCRHFDGRTRCCRLVLRSLPRSR